LWTYLHFEQLCLDCASCAAVFHLVIGEAAGESQGQQMAMRCCKWTGKGEEILLWPTKSPEKSRPLLLCRTYLRFWPRCGGVGVERGFMLDLGL